MRLDLDAGAADFLGTTMDAEANGGISFGLWMRSHRLLKLDWVICL